jgi:hypothetical protein
MRWSSPLPAVPCPLTQAAYAATVRLDDVQPLLDAPAPAVLTTYRKDVLADGDVKRQHLARTPRCILVVFEAVPPFRGVEVKGQPELIEQDVTEVREAIAGRYLGQDRGRRFAANRRSRRGTLLRLVPDQPRVWDLAAALPA